MKGKEIDKSKKRATMTFLMIMFPSLLLAILPMEIDGSVIWGLLLKVLVLGYQYLVTKNFIESHYGEE